MVEKLISYTIGVLMIAFISYIVAMAIADKQCLKAGYPQSTITYDFDFYCMNLDGDVTVKLKKID